MQKYNRTYHFSFSPEIKSDDKTLSKKAELENFINKDIIITEKLDGGNACLYQDKVFARSHLQEASHPSFSMLKSISSILNSNIDTQNILKEYEVFGENLEGIHSIEYYNLQSPFYIFNAKKENYWLSWEEIIKLSMKLKLPVVPNVYSGKFTTINELKNFLDKKIKEKSILGGDIEGFVVRPFNEFRDDEFSSVVGKYVRNGHVQTDEHWSKNYRTAKINKFWENFHV